MDKDKQKNLNESYDIPTISGDNINLRENISRPLETPTISRQNTLDIPNPVIVDETNMLYFYHLERQISELGMRLPLGNRFHGSSSTPRNANSLQVLANQFVISPQRRWVHEQALSVDLDSLNFHTFRQLLFDLFLEGDRAWERVLVLFYFCTDLSIRALQEKLIDCFIRLHNWTTCYISGRFSIWIEQQGGWDAVLQNSVSYATSLSVLGFCCIAALAIYIYLRNRK